METYAELEVFSVYDLVLFRTATALVRLLPTKLNGKWVRCHEVARAVAEVLKVPKAQVVDGYYGTSEHSWLWTRPKLVWETPPVLDVYAVGRVPPVMLIDPSRCPFDYRRGPLRTDIRRGVIKRLIKMMEHSP